MNTTDPELLEGFHYSIMFYGGRLLSHLSADDNEIEEFISLRKLNQNIAILIDSDKSNASDTINATKTRIVDEFEENSEFAWVTAGREIENYLQPDLLNKVLSSLFTDFETVVSSDQFEHRLNFRENNGGMRKADKVKVAHAVCQYPADLAVLDLREKIETLVSRIRAAND